MKSSCFLLLVCLGAASAQTPTSSPVPRQNTATAQPKAAPAFPDLPDSTVIAEFQDGTKMTVGELKQLYRVLPPALQNAVVQDPVEFFHEYATMLKYEEIAVDKKLDEQSPAKEAIHFARLINLYQAVLQDVFTNTQVDHAEIVNYYGKHREDFKSVKAKAIYIRFGDESSADEKLPTEEQAKAKAEKLVAQVKGGADFVKLVKEDSDDPESKAKDGDFATFNTGDSVPDAIRKAVFALGMGEVTEPVRQPHGFYIFKAEIVTVRPLSEVQDQIFMRLRQQHAKDWVDRVNAEVKVDFPNPAFPPKGVPSAPVK